MTGTKPSKTELKRQQRALQALGERLIDLDDEHLDRLALPEQLRQAIDDARRMKSREAMRRQKQYIGRLMRNVDTAAIRQLFDRLHADDRRSRRVFATAERWRDRIARERQPAIDAFEDESGRKHPDIRELVDALERATTDRIEAGLRRTLFRKIHAALVADQPDG